MNRRGLEQQLEAWFRNGVTAAGTGVVLCQRGCSACCLGPFDISPSDAEQVGRAVAGLDPAISSMILLRAEHQVGQYRDLTPEWSAPWDIDALGDDRFDQVSEQLASARCPALDSDGACLIYADRPVNCRMIGLPMVTPDGGVLENACPILHTSEAYAALDPVLFDLPAFEEAADELDDAARSRGWVRTTVSGAVAKAGAKKEAGDERG